VPTSDGRRKTKSTSQQRGSGHKNLQDTTTPVIAVTPFERQLKNSLRKKKKEDAIKETGRVRPGGGENNI